MDVVVFERASASLNEGVFNGLARFVHRDRYARLCQDISEPPM
jgi:hypothetical protein